MATRMPLPEIKLKKGEDRRLRAGHTWVFSNEVDVKRTPLDTFSPGDLVAFRAHSGNILGTGYVNPHSLICGRLVSRDPATPLPMLIHARVEQALALRNRLFHSSFYRLVFGESDGLPGLVVDRYGEFLVVQIGTAGMEQLREQVLDSLQAVLQPSGILLRNDTAARALEGLPSYVETARGSVPDHILLEENGAKFRIPVHGGQKTGWYYDHRGNRELMTRLVRNGRVLDVFGYLGAWAIQALTAGAVHATCIESSANNVTRIADNARLNDCEQRIELLDTDAFDALRSLRDEKREFDTVIVDPPAFIKRRKDTRNGTLTYKRINQAAMRLVSDGGILVSSSCSSHLARDGLRDILRRSAISTGVELRVLAQGGQHFDHPVHSAIPETEYLKCFFCRISR